MSDYNERKGTNVVYEVPPSFGHMRQHLHFPVRLHESAELFRSASLSYERDFGFAHSERVFSTNTTNFAFDLPKTVSSSVYTTLCSFPPLDFASGLIPNASANFALRFATAQSVEHFSVCVDSRPAELDVERPQAMGCFMRPQGQVMVTMARQGSVSSQTEGAWQGCWHG